MVQREECVCVRAPSFSPSRCAPYSTAACSRETRRYFLRRLRRVKKANGQIIACNEVRDFLPLRARAAFLSALPCRERQRTGVKGVCSRSNRGAGLESWSALLLGEAGAAARQP
jgi:hypothetical protein